MNKDQTVEIARRYAEAEGLDIGPFSQAVTSSYDVVEWLVCFQYNGPPINEEDRVDCPSPDAPTGIIVDDATGEARLFGWL